MKTENRGFGIKRGIKWVSLLLGVALVCMTMFGFMGMMGRMMWQNGQPQGRQQARQQQQEQPQYGAPNMPFEQFNPNSNYGPQGNSQPQYSAPNMPYQQFNPNQNYGPQANQGNNLEGMSVWLVDDNGDGIPDRGVIGNQPPQQTAPQGGRFAQGYGNSSGGYDSGYQQGFAQGYDNGSRNNAPRAQQGFAQGSNNYQNDAPRYQKGFGQQGQFDPRENMGRGEPQRGHRGGGLLSLPFMIVGGLIRLAILAGVVSVGFVFLRGFWSGFSGKK